MATPLRKLRQQGHSDDDIAFARLQQEASRRAGAPARTIGEILNGQPARSRPHAAPEDLTNRQLRRRGRYGQAALLADQEALGEADPARAEQAREAAATLKALARKPVNAEFNFFGGNVSVAHEFHDAIVDRLKASGATFAERATAQAVLAECIRWLGWQNYEVTRTAAEIGDRIGLAKGNTAAALALLERVGAISRVKRGRTKVITITPEGVFRGDVAHHAEAVAAYQAEVIQLRPAPAGKAAP